MENTPENAQQQAQTVTTSTQPDTAATITVPVGTTVNKEKYERAVARTDAAEQRVADLEKQIAELTAKGADAEKAVEEFKTKMADEAKAYAAERERMEAEIATKDKVAELLRADCIDPESGIASLKDDETIEQLKERKPHLFKQATKPSGLTPKDKPVSPDDAVLSGLRSALGI